MKEQIINDYVNNFLSNAELSTKYSLHRCTIQRLLKKECVTLRKRTPRIKVDHFFFSKYTEESCYWAGFILADGYIRTKKRFTLEIKLEKDDITHLQKFKNCIKFEGKIKDTYYCNVSISSSQIINDLKNNFDIETKKSLTCFISGKIPSDMIKHYIRGYFDGDGCITNTNKEKGYTQMSFLGTLKTIEFIREYFYNNGIKLRSKDMPDILKNKNIFIICYSGISAYKCLKMLYDNSIMFLNRKHELYKIIKERFEN